MFIKVKAQASNGGITGVILNWTEIESIEDISSGNTAQTVVTMRSGKRYTVNHNVTLWYCFLDKKELIGQP